MWNLLASKQLIKVANGGVGGAIKLDTSEMLSTVRTELEKHSLMSEDQDFIISGVPLLKSYEASTPLSDALEEAKDGGLSTLTVGTGTSPVIPKDTHWTLLTSADQLKILNTVEEITKGISLNKDQGLLKTTQDLIAPLTVNSLPASTTPRVQSETNVNAYFSKFAQSMATSSSDSASVSVTTPYGGGSASFSHAQAHSSSSSKVQTYLVGTYHVNKVLLTIDPTKLQVNQDFWTAIAKATSLTGGQSQFIGIVQALNKFGWYFPIELNLGGMLYSSQTTEESSWTDAQSSATSFGGSFHAAFDGIGGGAAYSHSTQKGTASAGASGSSSLTFTAVGGDVSEANDYPKWAKSLAPAINWSISSWDTMIPSVCLLASHHQGKSLASFVQKIIANNYASSPELGDLQPLIDCGKYATEINKYLFGS